MNPILTRKVIPERRRSPQPASGESYGPRTRRTVNWVLLVVSVVLVGLLAVGAHFWHGFQVQRLSASLLTRADQLEDENRPRLAVSYLDRYVRLNPNDQDVRIRMASMFDEVASSQWGTERDKSLAVDYYFRALRDFPVQPELMTEEQRATQTEILLRLGELLVELGEFRTAQELLTDLATDEPPNLEALKTFALAMYRRSDARSELSIELRNVLEDAVAAHPDDIALAATMAEFYRTRWMTHEDDQRSVTEQERIQHGKFVIDELVREHPQEPEAYLARYRYRNKFEQLDRDAMDPDVAEALRLAPEDPAVLQYAASHAVWQGDSAGAEDYFRRLNQVLPNSLVAYLGLSQMYQNQRRLSEAIDVLYEGLNVIGEDSLDLHLALARNLLLDGRTGQAEDHIQKYDDEYKRRRASLVQPVRTALENLIGIPKALCLLRKNQPASAQPILEKIVSTGTEPQRRQARLLLGATYAAQGHHDKASLIFDQEALADLESRELLLAAAESLLQVSRVNEAIRYYERLLEMQEDPEVCYLLARARLIETSELPADARNWGAFEESLERARQLAGEMRDDWRLDLLAAQHAIAARSDDTTFGIVRNLLEQTAQRHPDSIQLHQQLAMFAQRLRWQDLAEASYERIKQLSSDPTVVVVTRALLDEMQGKAGQAVALLQSTIQELSDSDTLPAREKRIQLRRSLASVHMRSGQLEKARQQWKQIHQEDPQNVTALRNLFEAALQAKDSDEVQQWEAKLAERLDGDSDDMLFYRAMRLVLPPNMSSDALEEAERLLAELELRRPTWAPARTLKAMLLDRQGRADEAIRAYTDAIQMGERRMLVFERKLTLLYEAGRFREVDETIDSLQRYLPMSQKLSTFAMAGALRNEQLDTALNIARRGAQMRPNDPQAWVWFGALLSTGEDANLENAERAFRRAVELEPFDLRSWRAYIGFAARTGNETLLREILDQLNGLQSRVPRDLRSQWHVTQASAWQSLGDRSNTARHLEAAVLVNPRNADSQVALAMFYLTQDREKSVRAMRAALNLEPNRTDARRVLAAHLATQGETEWEEAQSLLRRSSPETVDGVVDRRIMAKLAAGRGDLRDAHNLTRQILDGPLAEDEDRLFMARLAEVLDERESAQGHLQSLAGRRNANPEHVVALIHFLLRNEQLDEIPRWLGRLQSLEPGRWRPVALRAQWHFTRGELAEVETVIEPFVDRTIERAATDEARAETLRTAGDLYSQLKLHESAERQYRRLYELDNRQFARLVFSLARQQRFHDASAVCSEIEDAAGAAAILAAALVEQEANLHSAGHEADELLGEAAANFPRHFQLQLTLGHLALVRGQTDEALARYQLALELQPDNAAVLNNVAAILGERPETRARALTYIDQAIQLVGNQPDVLDTKGTILLHEGRLREAIQLLEQSVAVENADPRNLLHLTVAYLRMGETAKAQRTNRRLATLDLPVALMTETEQAMLEEVRQQLEE